MWILCPEKTSKLKNTGLWKQGQPKEKRHLLSGIASNDIPG